MYDDETNNYQETMTNHDWGFKHTGASTITVQDDEGNEYHIQPGESRYQLRQQNYNYFEYLERQWEREQTPSLYYKDAPDSEVRDKVLQELKMQAVNGEAWAVKEYNRVYLPKNGMQSYVKFELPDNMNELNSREFSRILIELMKSVSRGQMDLEQFDQLSSSIKNLVDVTDAAEIMEQIESLQSKISGSKDDQDDSVVETERKLIPLDDYRSKTSINGVSISETAGETTSISETKGGMYRGFDGGDDE